MSGGEDRESAPLFEYRDDDREVWEEDLADFVPARIFDAHAHLFQRTLVARDHWDKVHFKNADFSDLRRFTGTVFPGREVHYLGLGCPALGTDVDAHNRMMYEEFSQDPLSRMNRLTTPADTPEQIEADVKERGFIGLKPYRIFSVTGDAVECRIRDFLPERLLEVADHMGLWVTLHLSKSKASGDPENLADLEEYTARRFPRVKWILAHCARSFTYWPIQTGIERLRDMPNIHYDLSAVADVMPFVTLFQKEDHRRLFFGSDAIDSTAFHGGYVSLGRTWRGIKADELGTDLSHSTLKRPVLAIYQQLLATKHAADLATLSRDQVEDIFWRNAARALGVDWPE